MALLGGRKKQTFGQVPTPVGYQGGTGIGDGMIERQQMDMGAPVQGMGQLPNVANMPDMGGMQAQQPAKFKPNLLGVIGDAMQVFGGGQATYMQGVREQQLMAEKMRQRALEAQQERETSWQDYVRKSQYERENAAPKDPYRFESNSGDVYQVGPDGKPALLFKDPTPKTTYLTADNGDGTKTIVPIVNGIPQMGNVPTRPQVGAVVADPRKGGSAGNGTGGFRATGY